MKTFARAEWQRAQRALASARQLAESDPDSAASRAYYAAFHALTALFALRGQSFSKHSAVRAAIHRDLIRPGFFPEDLGRAYDFLMDLRESGDYGGITQVSRDDVVAGLQKAEDILNAVRKSCSDLNDPS